MFLGHFLIHNFANAPNTLPRRNLGKYPAILKEKDAIRGKNIPVWRQACVTFFLGTIWEYGFFKLRCNRHMTLYYFQAYKGLWLLNQNAHHYCELTSVEEAVEMWGGSWEKGSEACSGHETLLFKDHRVCMKRTFILGTLLSLSQQIRCYHTCSRPQAFSRK